MELLKLSPWASHLGIEQWVSKCGHGTRSISIASPTQGLLSWKFSVGPNNLYFNQSSRWFWCMLEFGNYCLELKSVLRPTLLFQFYNYLGVFMLGELETWNVTGQIFYDKMFCLVRYVAGDNLFINPFNKYFLNAYSVGTGQTILNKTEKSPASQGTILGWILYINTDINLAPWLKLPGARL